MSSKKEPAPKVKPNAKFDGVSSVAEMLNVMDPATRNKLLANMRKQNPQITEAVRQRMFIFQDLVRLPSKSLQTLLREIPPQRLVLSLRNVSEDFKKVLFKNLSQRSAQTLQEEIQALGPQRLSDVTAAQSEIVKIARKLVADSKMVLDEESG
jgi:flagellar motor switch protein FliG